MNPATLPSVRILIVGSGAREHAIVHALAHEQPTAGLHHELHAAPGNPGISELATVHAINPTDPDAVTALAQQLAVGLVVIGPEAPLVAGVADAVRAAGIACFGPSANAAQLEGSKAFAKDVMTAAHVPTAQAHVCTTLEQVETAFDTFGPPYVVKDDGLAAGKGVVVTPDRTEASRHAAACLAGGSGRVVIEEYLDGPEVSLFCVSDGRTIIPLTPAQDFKRAYDGDLGPNTGGMGAYSPLPWAPEGLADQVIRDIAQPTIDEMARQGTPFAGVLYVGLALTSRGVKVVEFNARFGDPETQVVLARLATPLSVVLWAAASGTLDTLPPLQWRDDAAVIVTIAAAGYPGEVRSGDVITGLQRAQELPGVSVLHAGTALSPDGEVVSAGGRVLSVVGVGPQLAVARERAYAALGIIGLDGALYRSDIAVRAT